MASIFSGNFAVANAGGMRLKRTWRQKNRWGRPQLELSVTPQVTMINFDCDIFIVFRQPGFSLLSRVPDDSSKFERGAATALRHLLFLLAAYAVFHKIFPFALLGSHLVDLTVGDFLRVLFQTLASIIGAAYLVAKSFRPPNLEFRDRVWCERWIAIAFGVIAHHGRIDGDRFARKKGL